MAVAHFDHVLVDALGGSAQGAFEPRTLYGAVVAVAADGVDYRVGVAQIDFELVDHVVGVPAQRSELAVVVDIRDPRLHVSLFDLFHHIGDGMDRGLHLSDIDEYCPGDGKIEQIEHPYPVETHRDDLKNERNRENGNRDDVEILEFRERGQIRHTRPCVVVMSI